MYAIVIFSTPLTFPGRPRKSVIVLIDNRSELQEFLEHYKKQEPHRSPEICYVATASRKQITYLTPYLNADCEVYKRNPQRQEFHLVPIQTSEIILSFLTFITKNRDTTPKVLVYQKLPDISATARLSKNQSVWLILIPLILLILVAILRLAINMWGAK